MSKVEILFAGCCTIFEVLPTKHKLTSQWDIAIAMLDGGHED